MAEIKISDLTLLVQNDVDGTNDELVIVDDGATATKKVKPGALIKGAGGFFADGSTPLSGTLNVAGNAIENITTILNSGNDGVQVSAGEVGLYLGGTRRFYLTGTTTVVDGTLVPGTDDLRSIGSNLSQWFRIFASSGSAAVPSIVVAGSNAATDSGLYAPDEDSLGIAIAGVARMTFAGSGILVNANPVPVGVRNLGASGTPWNETFSIAFLAGTGSAGSPAVRVSEAGMGLNNPSPGVLGLACTGENVATFSTSSINLDCPVQFYANGVLTSSVSSFGSFLAPFGSVSFPSVSFIASTNKGMFSPGPNQLGWAANNKALILDNDSATPSFRGSEDDTWTLGESDFRWSNGYFTSLDVGGAILSGGAFTGAVDLSGTTLVNGKPLRVSSSVETSTTYTLADANHGQILLVSSSALVTVPGSLQLGTQATVVNYMSGTQFRFTGSGGTSFIYPSDTFQTASAMSPRGSAVVFTVVRTAEVLVTGDLEAL